MLPGVDVAAETADSDMGAHLETQQEIINLTTKHTFKRSNRLTKKET
jgi:hypothetical protein